MKCLKTYPMTVNYSELADKEFAKFAESKLSELRAYWYISQKTNEIICDYISEMESMVHYIIFNDPNGQRLFDAPFSWFGKPVYNWYRPKELQELLESF